MNMRKYRVKSNAKMVVLIIVLPILLFVLMSSCTNNVLNMSENNEKELSPEDIKIEPINITLRERVRDGVYYTKYHTVEGKGQKLKVTNNSNVPIKEIELIYLDSANEDEKVKVTIGFDSFSDENYIMPGESIYSKEDTLKKEASYSKGIIMHEYKNLILVGMEIYCNDEYYEYWRKTELDDFELYSHAVDGTRVYEHEDYYNNPYK